MKWTFTVLEDVLMTVGDVDGGEGPFYVRSHGCIEAVLQTFFVNSLGPVPAVTQAFCCYTGLRDDLGLCIHSSFTSER